MNKKIILFSICFVCAAFFCGCIGSAEKDAKIISLTEALEALQVQLDEVQSVKEIEKIQALYLNYVIYNKLDDVWTLFSEEGVLDVFVEKEPAKGAKEITEIFQERKAMIEENSKDGQHAIIFDSSSIITVDGDTAKSTFLLFNIMSMDGENLGIQQGSYDIDFVKENGAWKISYLKYSREFSIGNGGMPEGAGPGKPGSPMGTAQKKVD
jgi:hypothetical protein